MSSKVDLNLKAMAKKAASKVAPAVKTITPSTKAAPRSRVSKTPAANTAEKMAPVKKAKTAAKVKVAAAAPESELDAPKKAAKSAAPKKPESTPATTATKRKAAEPAKPVAPPGTVTRKRKATPKIEEAQEDEDEPLPPQKKVKSALVPAPRKPKAVPAARKVKLGASINKAPDAKLDVFVFGEGSSGELGLGNAKVDGKKPIDVKRPRLNEFLCAQRVGVVQIAAGGMHVAALTYDNKIMTWGVNDQGALGRDTAWDGGLKEIDDDKSESSDNDEDTGINPLESTPGVVKGEHFPEGTKFVQVAASDSATFALTEDGSVYGWGTFRGNDGIIGFSEKSFVQQTPTKLPELKRITKIATGSNHVLALDNKGNVFAWGAGQQNQLGRRVVERTRTGGLVPREFGLPRGKIVDISCGAYHSFAIDNKGKVWTWGLNNFGETGIFEGAGEDNAVIFKPTVITALESYHIKEIRGGGHHSLACTEEGQLLVWGRADGSQPGIPIEELPKEDLVYDERGNARILAKPTILTIPSKIICSIAAGSDNSFAIDTTGKAYSWGFSANYQTGQGSDDDVLVPTLIDNSAVRDKKLTGAAGGGQYSIVYGEHLTQINGHA